MYQVNQYNYFVRKTFVKICFLCLGAHAQARWYTVVCVRACVCVSIGFYSHVYLDVNSWICKIMQVMPSFAYLECLFKRVHSETCPWSVATLLSSLLCTRTLAIDSCKALLIQPLILGLNFWHRSFLTTIMVDHYPLFVILDSACMQQNKNVHHKCV